MASTMFRTKTLEKLSSPEQLDRTLKVTSPRSWLFLLAFGIILTGAIIWGFLGRIPFSVAATGILTRVGGLNPILASQGGVLDHYIVSPGDVVKRGQPVAMVIKPDGKMAPLLSTISGRVIELWGSNGQLIQAGTTIATSEYTNTPLEAIVFADIASAKNIERGMKVTIKPINVESEKFGVLEGRVSTIAQYPSTTQGLDAIFFGDTLTRLLGTSGAFIRVDVSLVRDQSTTSGYQWSTKVGPPIRLTSGTPVRASIETQRIRPIEMVLPIHIDREVPSGTRVTHVGGSQTAKRPDSD